MKTINFENALDIKGIYVVPSKRIVGIPLFCQKGQEFRESPNCFELWQQNGDDKMHLVRRWKKKSIRYIEYAGLPNVWVQPKAGCVKKINDSETNQEGKSFGSVTGTY